MLDLFQRDWRDVWSGAEEVESVGAVFTKPEIVSLILDLAGYVPEATRLSDGRVLEPSCGDGAFTTELVRRLIASERVATAGRVRWSSTALENALSACDISARSVAAARELVVRLLGEEGCPSLRAAELAERWIVQTDFLLTSFPNRFDLIVGNPPYVRIEDLPKAVLLQYRELFATTTDRADIYIAFFEHGLRLLSEDGVLAFICANRFTKNKYGESLRRLISEQFRVRYYLNLEHTQPFLSDVSAYPAVFVIDKKVGEKTRARGLESLDARLLTSIRPGSRGHSRGWSVFENWYPRGAPWLSTDAGEQKRLATLAQKFPTIEQSALGTRIGIGVATGADNVFVLDEKHPDIEECLQIPLLLAGDVRNGGLNWSGHYLLNPFAPIDDGSLAAFRDYPGFARYMRANESALHNRHVARARPHNWYRTIDRVWPSLQRVPKLVMPDIQVGVVVGLDDGAYYPHHNLYWISSDTWDLAALKTLIRSIHVVSQIRAFSVAMRGGAIRFQAQTLRQVRVPPLQAIPPRLLKQLAKAASTDDQERVDALAGEAFALPAIRSSVRRRA